MDHVKLMAGALKANKADLKVAGTDLLDLGDLPAEAEFCSWWPKVKPFMEKLKGSLPFPYDLAAKAIFEASDMLYDIECGK